MKSYAADLLDKTERFVKTYFKRNHNKNIVFHNLKQTIKRVKICKKILSEHKIDTEEAFKIQSAAWFCTVGYLSPLKDPIAKSASVAKGFLIKAGCSLEYINKILELITSSVEPNHASDNLQEILFDALNYDYGSPNFIKKQKSLKNEREFLFGKKIGRLEWWEQQLSELTAFQYKTNLCRDRRNAQKLINADQLKERVMDMNISQIKEEPFKKRKRDQHEMGTETMFKITSSTNQRLSNMADNKAYILVTGNSIILSFTISLVLRRFEENRFLLVPLLILLCVCFLTIILSILAITTLIPKGTFSSREFDEKNINPLNFENFYKMNASDYSKGMFQVMQHSILFNNMLIKDVFSQGVVLDRKYRLLRYAYDIFMYGMIISVLIFFLT